MISESSTFTEKIVLLGTGTPNALPHRSGPSVAVIANGVPYLIDAGPGVVRRASEAFHSGLTALEPPNIRHVFFTHLHSDHTTGYPDLILAPWVLGREEPLEVYGPKGTREMTDHLHQAFKEDIRIRSNGPDGASEDGWRVNAHGIRSGIIFQDENVMVEAFPVNHGPWDAFGFRIVTQDRIIVISGDTAPTETMVEKAKDCDVLVHEVYSAKGLKGRPKEWQHYHRSKHTSTLELAGISERVQPGLLVLYHQLFWGTSDDELLREITEIYSGEVISGKDLLVI